jgi:glycosyltransferase involved in cell wall biosynthesis
MFDALAAGKPILTNMPGWLGDLAEQNRTGVLVRPDDPVDFANKAVWMRDHPDDLAVFGRNGRRLAEEQFSRDVLAKRLEAVLDEAAAASAPSYGRQPVSQQI